MKRIIYLLLIIITFASMSIPSVASSRIPKDIDSIDAVIAAYYYAGSLEENDDYATTVYNVVPLYDISSSIRAYYVTFSSDIYAVISNNIDNPQALEFGKGCNEKIEEFIKENPEEKIVYNNPVNINKLSDAKALSLITPKEYFDIDYYYRDLNKKNTALAECVKSTKKEIMNCNYIKDANADYGFLASSALQSGKYVSDTIRSAGTVDWAITGDYNDIASDHCGATAVTNLALYFAKNGKTNLKLKTKRDTFIAVHKFVGNGPKTTIADEAKKYFSDRGYTLNYNTETAKKQNIKTATTNERPCGILLTNKINDWHWVISVGWREYTSSGDFYVRIVNGWDNTIDRYYKPNSGSQWWTVTSYWVS